MSQVESVFSVKISCCSRSSGLPEEVVKIQAARHFLESSHPAWQIEVVPMNVRQRRTREFCFDALAIVLACQHPQLVMPRHVAHEVPTDTGLGTFARLACVGGD